MFFHALCHFTSYAFLDYPPTAWHLSDLPSKTSPETLLEFLPVHPVKSSCTPSGPMTTLSSTCYSLLCLFASITSFCVMLGGFLNLSEPQFSNGDDNNTYLSWGLNESLHLEHLEQGLSHSNLAVSASCYFFSSVDSTARGQDQILVSLETRTVPNKICLGNFSEWI